MKIDEILDKMKKIAGKLDGKDHLMYLNQDSIREIIKYIEELEFKLKATEQVAINWKEKYEISTKSLDVDYIDNLKN
jgi:hypothetical protein